MTTLVTKQGSERITFDTWKLSEVYAAGDAVVKNNNIYIANADIPVNTAFVEGTSGATWSKAVTGYDNSQNPPLLICEQTCGGFGRLHAWGNKIFRAGAGHTTGNGNMYAGGMASVTNTIGYTCLDELPTSWKKIYDTRANFYGLGSNGVLYVGGENGYGQLGVGAHIDTLYQFMMNKHPALYGNGITVLDFWGADLIGNSMNYLAHCWVHVNDNGILKLYSFGYNTNGSLGNNTTSTDQFVPYEHTMMRGKSIKVVRSMTTSVRGNAISVVVTSTGELWATGKNDLGGIANGSTTDSTVLLRSMYNATTPVNDADDVQLSWNAGDGRAVHLLTKSGTVYSTGNNDNGRLGIGSLTNVTVTFYNQVLTAANTPLTNIKKIKASCNGVIALSNDNFVYFTGKNNDGMWGNGQASHANSVAGYAELKQAYVKDFWTVGVYTGWQAVWYLKTDNTLWASGGNHHLQLGVFDGGANSQYNITIKQVALPKGEYPVQFKWLGGYYDDSSVGGTTNTLLGGGVLMVSNTNKLYTWGMPYIQVASIAGFQQQDKVRWPTLITDYYPRQQF